MKPVSEICNRWFSVIMTFDDIVHFLGAGD